MWLVVALLIGFLFGACSNTKYLQNEETLYLGAYVKINSDKKIKNKGDLENELKLLATPKPNRRFFNQLAFRLWVYNKTKNAEKGLKKWLKESYAEPPVLFNPSDTTTSIAKMKNHLFKNGYFVNKVEAFTDINKQRAEVQYDAYVNHRYRFGTVKYPKNKRGINRVVNFYNKEGLLKTDAPFSINLLNEERVRITKDARNNGYFRFAKDYIVFEFDSTKNDYKVDVTIKINNVDSITRHRRSYIRRVNIYSDYNPNSTKNVSGLDSVQLGFKKYVYKNDVVKHAALNRSVLFKKGRVFKMDEYNGTINKLINLGIYKFVNVKISPYKTENYDSLDATIFLTTKDKIEFEADLEVNTKFEGAGFEIAESNLGSAVSLSHNNLNTFKGAERFVISLLAGAEFNLGKRETIVENMDTTLAGRIGAFEFSAQSSLLIPRFWLPFRNEYDFSNLIPKTVFGLGASYFDTNLYNTIGLNASYGYQWSSTLSKQHRLDPVSINYFQLLNFSDEFEEEQMESITLRSSFEDQLLFGSKYTYVYNSILKEENKNYYYFKGSGELIGNLLNSFIKDTVNTVNDTVNKKLFGVRTAQFVKFDAEGKYYRIFSKNHLLATRIIGGIGIPYGNSEVLPYSRQYYAGGTNGIRAFEARTLGPGIAPLDTALNNFVNQTGELKLEASAEYRFDLAKYLEGALFVDLGNVWQIGNKESPHNNIKENFKFNRFLKDIAVGTGIGLRLDFSYFIIRGDVAIPLRKQWDGTSGFKWINTNRYKLEGTENFVINIAIGYPF